MFFPLQFFRQQLVQMFRIGSEVEKILFGSYILFFILLFLYSYTQIDLGLVITRISWLYNIEKQFQYIGYFNRPLSTMLFVLLILIFFGLYFWSLWLLHKKKIRSFVVWSIVGMGAIILTFSYNAFSYDLFNYIFDAKILTHYHMNPYAHQALDFPHDPMLGFMHWVNRTYPYGPFWLVATVPLSFIGGNIFIITFFLFKILMTAAYLGTIYFMDRIMREMKIENRVFRVALFALNPLVIIESLVSSHNDIVMFFFAFVAIYFLFVRKFIFASVLLIVSLGIKFATVLLIPAFIELFFWRKSPTIKKERAFLFMFCLMFIALYVVSIRTNYQPWYLLYVLLFLPFLQQKWLQIGLVFLSFTSMLLYIPFLADGNWNGVAYTMQITSYVWVISIAALISVLYGCYHIFAKRLTRV